MITGAMLYYVNDPLSLEGPSLSLLDYLQLTNRRSGCFSDYALQKIVRLTVESNVLTGVYDLDSGRDTHFVCFQQPMGL
jgi:hypothetical protein